MECISKIWQLFVDIVMCINDSFCYILFGMIVTVLGAFSAIMLYRYGYFNKKFHAFLSEKLARNLSNANISILANDKLDDLKGTILNSGIFNPKNIVGLSFNNTMNTTNISDVFKDKKIDLLVIDYAELIKVFCNEQTAEDVKNRDTPNDCDKILLNIINHLGEKTFFIIYAPDIFIPNPTMKELSPKSNLTITNFKGRLLSDIFTSLVTRPNS